MLARIRELFAASLLLGAMALATPASAEGCPPGTTPLFGGGIYGLDTGATGSEITGCMSNNPVMPSNDLPRQAEEPYDPWDFTGIHIEVVEPEKLRDASLDSGKAYRVTLPPGNTLNVFDRPGGNVVGALPSGAGDVRARYYYVADVRNVWAGVCAHQGPCGWVAADYIFNLPPGARNYGIHSVAVPELYAFERPDVNSGSSGSLFQGNRVAVIDHAYSDDGEWARVCRMESCAWVGSEFLNFEY